MNGSILPTCYLGAFFLIVSACSGQTMVKDPTGLSQNMVPKGWIVETQQDDGTYLWMARKSAEDTSPGLMQLILPDAAYSPKALTMAILGESVEGITFISEQEINNNVGHFLLEGYIHNIQARIAVCVIRDPGKYLFFSTFSAMPAEFEQLGGAGLLYQAIQSPDPYENTIASTSSAETATVQPPGYTPSSTLNMQDPQVKRHMIQSSAPFTSKDIIGSWMQVFGYATGNDAQHVVSGQITLGARGQGHMLHLRANGTYELSYLYNLVSGVCRNRSEISETGKWSVSGKQLTLRPDRYSGKVTVCGKDHSENKRNPPARQFTIGTDQSHHHLTIFGKPFEYSINTDWDENGVVYILEGFTRVE